MSCIFSMCLFTCVIGNVSELQTDERTERTYRRRYLTKDISVDTEKESRHPTENNIHLENTLNQYDSIN
jgi:hypothetical protein